VNVRKDHSATLARRRVAEGTYLVAVAGANTGGDIWTSANGGANWADRTSAAGGNPTAHDLFWASVASDATGTHLVAVSGGGDIWTSANSEDPELAAEMA
jgi:hypothetical protein